MAKFTDINPFLINRDAPFCRENHFSGRLSGRSALFHGRYLTEISPSIFVRKIKNTVDKIMRIAKQIPPLLFVSIGLALIENGPLLITIPLNIGTYYLAEYVMRELDLANRILGSPKQVVILNYNCK